jgi:hypothetical protein
MVVGKSQRISLDSDENQNTDLGSGSPSIDHSGRYVAFTSASSQLLPAGQDTNGVADVFLRDRGNPGAGAFILSFGSTSRVSYGTFFDFINQIFNRFVQISGASSEPSISANGRFVAFTNATNCVVSGIFCLDQNSVNDVFVRDTMAGTELTTWSSVTSGGLSSNGASSFGSVADNGEFISFQSVATDLVSPDANGANSDVYLRRTTNPFELSSAVSRRTHAAAGNFDLPIALSGPVTFEPREGGVQQVRMTFSSNVFAADGTVSCNEIGVFGGSCVSASASGAVITLNLTSQLNRCVEIHLQGLQDSSGRPLEGFTGFFVQNHQGQVDPSPGVNLLDLQAVKVQLFQAVNGSTFLLDVNTDGLINLLDLQSIKLNLFQPPLCP